MSLAGEVLTARLRLRHWRPEDEAAMALINADPEVTRYLNRPVGPTAVKGFYEVVTAHWAEYGFGLWAAESREPGLAGRLIGFVGVAHPTFLPELAERVEIGWRLARPAWGRGLASEGATAARDDAFGTLALSELISIIHPDNRRSQRVAIKLGMTMSEHVENPHMGRAVEVWRIIAAPVAPSPVPTPDRSARRG